MTAPEQRTCQSCQAEFTIAPEDFAFYKKIDVPPPTWCPDCRAQRRMAWRNEWHLFRKPDASTGEPTFSAFSPNSSVKILSNERWNSDDWDALKFGRPYDFSRPFFAQFNELLSEVPLQARSAINIDNSDYCISCAWVKNCYLVAVSVKTQDSAYLVYDGGSRNCFDSLVTENCELCYGSVNLVNCYKVWFSVNCQNSRDVILSRDLIGCQNCFGCTNLRGKQYYIWNQPYTKEQYETKLQQLNLNSTQNLERLRAEAGNFWLKYPNPPSVGSGNEQATGEYLNHCKNAIHCYFARGLVDCKYCQAAPSETSSECYDCSGLASGAELVYESIGAVSQVYNCKFAWRCRDGCRNVQYSAFCEKSQDLFGCVSVKNKRYCIFNKQYTQEEYEQLVPKIIEQMNEMPYTDKLGRIYKYGEFFPAELSPCEYNVSMAKEHFPLNKSEAQAAGYSWYDQPGRNTTTQLLADELPDVITDAASSILGKTIACLHQGACEEECTSAFTIVGQELAFLLENGLPLPRLCPNCRLYGRIWQRRGLKLYARQCQCVGVGSKNGEYATIDLDHRAHSQNEPCPTLMSSSFAPDRPEIVYCEACYLGEVI